MPRAGISQNHEAGGAVPAPALPDIGAAGLLADRVQPLGAHQMLQKAETLAAAGSWIASAPTSVLFPMVRMLLSYKTQ